MNRLILTFIVTLLVGCASVPTWEELATADYGRPMLQEECESLVKQIMNRYLIDPSSVQYSFQNCYKAGVHSIPAMGLPKQYGYFIIVDINAKNRFGGYYVGKKKHKFLFKNGQVIRKTKPGNKGYGQFPF